MSDQQDNNISRKRKANNALYRFKSSLSDPDLDLDLDLGLGPPLQPLPIPIPLPSLPPPPNYYFNLTPGAPQHSVAAPSPQPTLTTTATPRPPRNRRTPSQSTRQGQNETITPPFPWATDKKAKIHTIEHLLANQITTITGQVQCKKCERKYEMGFDLQEKFLEVGKFIMERKTSLHERAPDEWTNPVLPACNFCHAENCVKPVIADKKRSINWLFLLLGQMLGCCTLEQLKYFCKHTSNHRTGAKDRVLYLAYLCVCKQLQPSGPFNR